MYMNKAQNIYKGGIRELAIKAINSTKDGMSPSKLARLTKESISSPYLLLVSVSMSLKPLARKITLYPRQSQLI